MLNEAVLHHYNNKFTMLSTWTHVRIPFLFPNRNGLFARLPQLNSIHERVGSVKSHFVEQVHVFSLKNTSINRQLTLTVTYCRGISLPWMFSM